MSLDKIVANGIGDLVAERDALAARVQYAESMLESIADLVGYSKSESDAYSLPELLEALAGDLEDHLNAKGKDYTLRQLMTLACNRIYEGSFPRGTCKAHGKSLHSHTSTCMEWILA